jgi:hypothetical protein
MVLGINAVFQARPRPWSSTVRSSPPKKSASAVASTARFPVAFATWELPEAAARWCPDHAGVRLRARRRGRSPGESRIPW